jgi:hypothetical protein
MFGQRRKEGPLVHEATLVLNFESRNRNAGAHVLGNTVDSAHENSLPQSNSWWAAMGIDGMEGKGGFLSRQYSTSIAPQSHPAAADVTSTREIVRTTFGVKVRESVGDVIMSCISCNLTIFVMLSDCIQCF